MRRPPELKECPRCKLKNRQGAYQCDFCGWDFKAASDEWMGKVIDLEKIGKSVEAPAPDLDRHTAARVEMTIKKPLDIKAPEPPPAEEPETTVALEEEAQEIEQPIVEEAGELEIVARTTVIEEPEAGPIAENMVEEPTDETDAPAEAMGTVVEECPSEPEPEAAAEVAEIMPEPPKEEPAIEDVITVEQPINAEPVRTASSSNIKEEQPLNPLLIPSSLFIAGIVIYITALAVAPGLGKAVGWGLAIIGAALITLAVQQIIKLRRRGREDEIVLCPNCHEVVTDHDSGCPSCGSKFTKPIVKE